MGLEVYDSNDDDHKTRSKTTATKAARRDLYLCIETEAIMLENIMAIEEPQGLLRSARDSSAGMARGKGSRFTKYGSSDQARSIEATFWGRSPCFSTPELRKDSGGGKNACSLGALTSNNSQTEYLFQTTDRATRSGAIKR